MPGLKLATATAHQVPRTELHLAVEAVSAVPEADSLEVEAVDSAAVAVEDLEVDLVEAMEVVPAAAAAVDSEAELVVDLEVVVEEDSVADSEVDSEEAAAPPSRNTSTSTYPHQNLKSSDHKDLSQWLKLRNTTKSSSSRPQVRLHQLPQ